MRADLFALLCLVLAICVPCAATWLSGGVYLPRHPAAHDLPWARATAPPGLAQPDNHQLADKLRLIYPDYIHNARALRRGDLPLWNPLILGGVPHAANPMTAVFYPPNWLHAFVPEPDVPLVAASLHLLLGGSFMLLFLRVARLAPIPSLFGALAFAFSGWVASHLQNTPLVATVIWIPLGFAGLEALHRGVGRFGGPTLALAVGMPWLAGFPQFAVLGNLALAAYAGACLVAHTRAAGVRAALRRGLLLAGCAGAGLLLAGAQLAPTLEARAHAGRGSRSLDDLVSERFRPAALVGLALPRALGDPMTDGDWRTHDLARRVLGEGEGRLPPQVTNWGERTVYVGALTLLLAAWGATRMRQRVPATLLAVAILGVGLACSETLIRMYGRIPGFDFGAPARAILLSAVALPALAAVGLQRMMEREGQPRASCRALAWTAALAGVGALWASASSGLRVDLAAISAQLGLLALVLHRTSRPRVVAVAAGVILTADLLAFFAPVNQPVRREALFASTPALRFLADNLGDGRFLRVSATDELAVADRLDLLHPNLGTLADLADAQGYRELVPAPYLALWRGLPSLWTPVGFSGLPAARVDSAVLDITAVRYLIAARAIPALADRQVYPTAGSADLWIYANPDAMPRAWIARRALVVSDAEALARIHAGDVDMPAEVLVAHLPSGAASGGPACTSAARAQLVCDDGDELVVDVACDGAGYLVLADTWFPGWEAQAIGRGGEARRLEIVRAMSCLRAVAIDADVTQVRFRYRPRSVTIGLAASALGFLGLVLVFPWARGRPRPCA